MENDNKQLDKHDQLFSQNSLFCNLLRHFSQNMCSKQQDVEQLLLNKGVCLTNLQTLGRRGISEIPFV